MISRRLTLVVLGMACALIGIAVTNSLASAISEPQYYVLAEIIEIKTARGGLHTLSFKVKDLVKNQNKYGGYCSPDALSDELSTEKIYALQITLNPEVGVEVGETIVVGVIHGSSMGENGAVPWIVFAHPYLEDGTPIRVYYPARN